jgi:hypothetical protein
MSSISVAGNTSGSITLSAPDISGSNTLSLPAVTDTLAGLSATQTLTNKTLTSPTLTSPALGTVASGVISACTSTNMVLVTPALGTPSALVGTNITGTANSLNAGLGVNQVWARIANSAGVTYTNSTGKPIAVIIKATGFIDWTVTIGGVPTTLQYVNASFIVPNGLTYLVTGGTIAANCWSELR